MIDRPYWRSRLDQAWQEAPIVWLAGVRRSGKTTLARTLGSAGVVWLNCDIPAVEDIVRQPDTFFRSSGAQVVVFDEIHQLRDPARVLKVGADMFPELRLLATGSSTLAASKKFRDTLAGRKRLVHLTPVTWSELPAFGVGLAQRLLHGGLPQAMLATEKQPSFYREWLDSFFARDIQRLFGFRDINRFNAVFEFVLRQSGGQFATTKAATALGIARPTLESHLQALEVTHAVTVVRPYHGAHVTELVRQAKVYGFDTGFVSFVRGWDSLRPDDCGPLWEHVVLEHLQAMCPLTRPQYWRDRAGHEIDFVLPRGRGNVDTIECKWDPGHFRAKSLAAFRTLHPRGRNYLVTPGAVNPYEITAGPLTVQVCTPDGLACG